MVQNLLAGSCTWTGVNGGFQDGMVTINLSAVEWHLRDPIPKTYTRQVKFNADTGNWVLTTV